MAGGGKQKQLAALAPSSGASRHLLPLRRRRAGTVGLSGARAKRDSRLNPAPTRNSPATVSFRSCLTRIQPTYPVGRKAQRIERLPLPERVLLIARQLPRAARQWPGIASQHLPAVHRTPDPCPAQAPPDIVVRLVHRTQNS